MGAQFIPVDPAHIKFRIGVLTISRAAQVHCLGHDIHPSNLVNAHQCGNAGDHSTPEEIRAYERARVEGGDIISRWGVDTLTVMITTSGNRKTTHMKLAGE